jgi:hypothetical protein
MSNDFFEEIFDDVDPARKISLEGTVMNKHFKQEFIELEVESEILFRNELFYKTNEDGTELMVAYLAPDEYPPSHEFEEGESFVEHRSAADRDRDFMEKQEAGLNPMLVERYSHSGVDYSIMNTKSYPDRQFDVALSGVYVPCSYVRNELEKGNIDLDEVVRQANVALKTFSDYSNGYCYDSTVEIFKYDEATEQWEQSDIHRGFATGYEEAVADLKGLAGGLGKDFESETVVVKKAHVPNVSGPSM